MDEVMDEDGGRCGLSGWLWWWADRQRQRRGIWGGEGQAEGDAGLFMYSTRDRRPKPG